MSMNHIYLSIAFGERFKITESNASVVWAVKYGNVGFGMGLSLDGSHLLAGSKFSNVIHLGILSSSNGSVLSSYSVSTS